MDAVAKDSSADIVSDKGGSPGVKKPAVPDEDVFAAGDSSEVDSANKQRADVSKAIEADSSSVDPVGAIGLPPPTEASGPGIASSRSRRRGSRRHRAAYDAGTMVVKPVSTVHETDEDTVEHSQNGESTAEEPATAAAA